jgi:hypothetical protein
MKDVEIHTGPAFEGTKEDFGAWRQREIKRLNRLLLISYLKLTAVIALSALFTYSIVMSAIDIYGATAIITALALSQFKPSKGS